MKSGVLIPQLTSNIRYDTWVRIYSATLTEAATSLTISGLNGDIAKEFKLEARIVNGYDGAAFFLVRPNNVSTASNYGYQQLVGLNDTYEAARGTYAAYYIGYAGALNNLSQGSLIIQATSGYVRTAINEYARTITGTTVTAIVVSGQSWNNTADNITQFNIISDQISGLGIGSQITLWSRNHR